MTQLHLAVVGVETERVFWEQRLQSQAPISEEVRQVLRERAMADVVEALAPQEELETREFAIE